MWRFLVGPCTLLLMVGAIVCGDGEDELCDLRTWYATQGDGPAPVVSLEEARRLADFDIVLPADLPAGATIGGVTPSLVPCTDRATLVNISILGPGWIVTLEETGGEITHASSSPFRINGVDARIERHMGQLGPVISVSWTDGERSYVGAAQLTGGLTEQEFLQILESIPE